MSNEWQSGWGAGTPCGMYYTYETNKSTNEEKLVRHYCDGYYDWQPMIDRIREHIAKIAKGDTMSRYEDMTDEEKSSFDSHIERELKVRDEEISYLKGEIEDRDKRLDVKEEEVDSHLYDIEALDREKENLAETIRKLKDNMDDMVLRRYMIILLKGIGDMIDKAIESQHIKDMREAKKCVDETIRVHNPKDMEV